MSKTKIYKIGPNCLYPKCPFYCSNKHKFIKSSLTLEEEDIVRLRMYKSTIIDILVKYNWIDKWKSEYSNQYEYCQGCDIGFSKVEKLPKGIKLDPELSSLFENACEEVL